MAFVLICGDRNWSDKEKVWTRIRKLPHSDTIIHGGATGADAIAGRTAWEMGIKVLAFPADWAKYGKAAGPIRNRVMLDLKPVLVIAFHSDLSKSKGTADTVNEAKRRGIPVEVIA